MLRHWSQFVPNMSTDIRGHEALHDHHEEASWALLVGMECMKSSFPLISGPVCSELTFENTTVMLPFYALQSIPVTS